MICGGRATRQLRRISTAITARRFVGLTDSLGEQVQRALPQAHVVKTLHGQRESDDQLGLDRRGAQHVCVRQGAGAKEQTTQLLRELGWRRVSDLGGIAEARVTEPLVLLWVRYRLKHNTWGHTISLFMPKSGPKTRWQVEEIPPTRPDPYGGLFAGLYEAEVARKQLRKDPVLSRFTRTLLCKGYKVMNYSKTL